MTATICTTPSLYSEHSARIAPYSEHHTVTFRFYCHGENIRTALLCYLDTLFFGNTWSSSAFYNYIFIIKVANGTRICASGFRIMSTVSNHREHSHLLQEDVLTLTCRCVVCVRDKNKEKMLQFKPLHFTTITLYKAGRYDPK